MQIEDRNFGIDVHGLQMKVLIWQKTGFAEQWRMGQDMCSWMWVKIQQLGSKSLQMQKICWISDCPIPDGKWNVYLNSMIPMSWNTQQMESGPLGLLERTGGDVTKLGWLKFRAHYNLASSQDRDTTSREQEENKQIWRISSSISCGYRPCYISGLFIKLLQFHIFRACHTGAGEPSSKVLTNHAGRVCPFRMGHTLTFSII